MTKYVSEYGQKWDARVPRYAIRFLVGRQHVSMDDSAIADFIESRITPSNDKDKFTPSLVRQCREYAVIVHQRNRGVYVDVMRGSK